MKVVKQPPGPLPAWRGRFKCGGCKAVLDVEESDIILGTDTTLMCLDFTATMYFRCPCCMKFNHVACDEIRNLEIRRRISTTNEQCPDIVSAVMPERVIMRKH